MLTDMALLALVGIFSLRGFFRGGLRETLSLLSLGLALAAALRYGGFAEQELKRWVHDPQWLGQGSRALTFLAVWLVSGLGTRWIFSGALQATHGMRGRVTGGALGLAKGLAIAVILFSSLQTYAPSLLAHGEGHIFIPLLRTVAAFLRPLLSG